MGKTYALGLLAITLVIGAGLAACGGGGGGTPGAGVDDPGDPPAGDLTVVVRVLSQRGDPQPNVAVVLDDAGPALTDLTGRVQFTEVAAPYDVTVFDPADNIATVYVGLQRADPVLRLHADAPERTVSLEGQITGGIGFPMPALHVLEVHASVEGVGHVGKLGPSPVSGYYISGPLTWRGEATARLTLATLQYAVDTEGHALSFTGYGERTITVEDGDVLTDVNLVMEPVGTEVVSGTVSLPPGFQPVQRYATVHVTRDTSLQLPNAPWDPEAFAFRVPAIPDTMCTLAEIGMTLDAIYLAGWVRGLRPPGSGVPLEVPHPAACGFPVEGATGIGYETPFLAGPDEADRVFQFRFAAQPDGPLINLYTAAPTVTLPDLGSWGLGFPAGAPCIWNVSQEGPVGSMDDFADEEYGLTTTPGTRSAFYSTMTQWRAFTFGP